MIPSMLLQVFVGDHVTILPYSLEICCILSQTKCTMNGNKCTGTFWAMINSLAQQSKVCPMSSARPKTSDRRRQNSTFYWPSGPPWRRMWCPLWPTSLLEYFVMAKRHACKASVEIGCFSSQKKCTTNGIKFKDAFLALTSYMMIWAQRAHHGSAETRWMVSSWDDVWATFCRSCSRRK